MTTPKDCIEQITGGASPDWDINDTMSFNIYNVEKYNGRTVCIDFEKGVVEVYSEDSVTVEHRFAIEIVLHPLPLSPTTGVSGTVEQ